MKVNRHLLAVLAVCIMSLGLGACAHHDTATTPEAVPGATTVGNDPYNGSATVQSASGYSSTIGVADPNANPATNTGATVSSPSSATLGGSNTTTGSMSANNNTNSNFSNNTTSTTSVSGTSGTSASNTTDTTAMTSSSLNTNNNSNSGSMTSSSNTNDQSDTSSTTTTHRRMRKD